MAPAAEARDLGQHIQLSSDKVVVRPLTERVAQQVALLKSFKTNGRVHPAEAGTAVGKQGFLCSSLHGRIGRTACRALFERQHSSRSEMTRSLEFAIDLSIQVLTDPIPRVHRFDDSFRLPPLVYIDAFFETGGACYNLSTGAAAPWLANTSLTAANGIGGIIFLPQGQAW